MCSLRETGEPRGENLQKHLKPFQFCGKLKEM